MAMIIKGVWAHRGAVRYPSQQQRKVLIGEPD
jgi:hypothetical protein